MTWVLKVGPKKQRNPQEAEKMYSNAIPAGSLVILTKLVDETNRDLKVHSVDNSELKTLKNYSTTSVVLPL